MRNQNVLLIYYYQKMNALCDANNRVTTKTNVYLLYLIKQIFYPT